MWVCRNLGYVMSKQGVWGEDRNCEIYREIK